MQRKEKLLPSRLGECEAVIFKIERIDIPENDEERDWLDKQDFSNSAEDAYTG